MKQTSAKVLVSSISPDLAVLTTFQVTAPKFLDAETEKHRILSSNASSDRAIPFKSMSERDYFLPTDVRLNEKGMQGHQVMNDDEVAKFHEDLISLHGYTIDILSSWNHVHKQHLNRYLMGFSWQDKIISGTDWENFYFRRLAGDADPAIQQMAVAMKEASTNIVHELLYPGQWHLPYITADEKLDLDTDWRLVSAGRTARASYYNHDKSDPIVKEDLGLAKWLFNNGHPTPFENQATPMSETRWIPSLLPEPEFADGVTHMDRDLNYWSANIKGWVQHRQLIGV